MTSLTALDQAVREVTTREDLSVVLTYEHLRMVLAAPATAR